MDTLWIVFGTSLGLLFGVMATVLWKSRGETPEARVVAVEAEVARLRADYNDTLDKIALLYDRVRKRTEFAKPLSNNDSPSGVLLDRKGELRKRAANSGVFRALTHPIR